jgi:two-component system, chemotaxis family, CheB/CheR fusion protein
MAVTRCKTRGAYLALVDREPNEVNTLVCSTLIKLTTFFRTPAVWSALDKERLKR